MACANNLGLSLNSALQRIGLQCQNQSEVQVFRRKVNALHSKQTVLHSASNPNTGQNLISNHVLSRRKFSDGVHEGGSGDEECRSAEKEVPVSSNFTDDLSRGNDGDDDTVNVNVSMKKQKVRER